MFLRARLMDALSQLIELAGIRAVLDLRCQFGDSYAIDHQVATDDEIFFHLVLSGRCLMEVAGSTVTMNAGDFAALPRGSAHRIRSIDKPDAAFASVMDDTGSWPVRRAASQPIELDLLCGRFTHHSSVVKGLFDALPGVMHVSLRKAIDERDLQQIVNTIRTEVASDQPGASAIVASLSTVLFTIALRASGRHGAIAPGLMRLLANERLGKAAQALMNDPGRDWQVEDLASTVAMSRATFARRFAAVAAGTPGELLLQLRVSKASQLLIETRRSVADIGEQVGYRSEAAFAKAFKKAMGKSPAAFRKRL